MGEKLKEKKGEMFHAWKMLQKNPFVVSNPNAFGYALRIILATMAVKSFGQYVQYESDYKNFMRINSHEGHAAVPKYIESNQVFNKLRNEIFEENEKNSPGTNF